MSTPRDPRPAVIRRGLLRWYDRHRRDLPWRRTKDPYAIWVSEIMLQQTQVATAIPFYERFLRRFPGITALANAPLREVLRLWAGLGYYARARNLHSAACIVRDRHAGRIPRDTKSLRGLPGIGRYTAGAIASIAFGRREAVVDGNVARVVSRLFDLAEDVAAGPGLEKTWKLATSLLPTKRCGDFNQAMMELGATVCLPGGAARCEACPLAGCCRARRRGTVAQRPSPKRKGVVRRETHVVAVIRRGDKWLVRKRPSRGLWGGLWELPSEPLHGRSVREHARRLAESLAGRVRAAGQHGPKSNASRRIATVRELPCCDVTRVLSHRTIRFVGYAFKAANGAMKETADIKWVRPRDAGKLGLSMAMDIVMKQILSEDTRRRGPFDAPPTTSL